MEVPYGEDVASHIGPESCVGIREGAGEALTGESAGQVLSRERKHFGVPTRSFHSEGNMDEWHCRRFSARHGFSGSRWACEAIPRHAQRGPNTRRRSPKSHGSAIRNMDHPAIARDGSTPRGLRARAQIK